MHPKDVAQKLTDQAARTEKFRRWSYARKPKAISDVLAQLIAKRGYGATETNAQLEQTWADLAGRYAGATRALKINRGRLEVLVAHSTVLQELTFEKARLLKAAQQAMPDARISDLRFRVGKLD